MNWKKNIYIYIYIYIYAEIKIWIFGSSNIVFDDCRPWSQKGLNPLL